MTSPASSRHSNASTHPRKGSDPGKRVHQTPRFSLVELDPRRVVDGELVSGGFMGEDAPAVGTMREACPYCKGLPLQLVLRHGHVIRSHLVCRTCTRCFDAIYPDGSSALTVPGVPIE
jgi:hypothetical protein